MRKQALVYSMAIFVGSIGSAFSEDVPRAARIIEWLGNDLYFENPGSFTAEGMATPRIGSGSLFSHPTRPMEKHRYRWELLKQAEILAMSGDDGLTTILGALHHKEYYVRVIAALALDKMLSVEYSENIFTITGNKELWISPSESNTLVVRYSERARQCFPDRFE